MLVQMVWLDEHLALYSCAINCFKAHKEADA